MNSLIAGNFLIELIRIFDGAVLDTRRTTGALFFDDIPRPFRQGNLEITWIAFDTVNFCKSQNFDVWMPADLDQFG